VDRCALFVDAGYLLADGAMAVHGTRHREAVAWDYPGLLHLLSTLSRERTDLPLLRCYWYEATVEGRRTSEHDALADIPGLKLRLARIRPGRREGVDAQVHRDLMTLARNNAICDAVVVSGDEDLAQVVSDAQDLGIRVTVIHITAEGSWAVSRTLQQECDDLIEIGGGHLRPYVNLVTGNVAGGGDTGSIPGNGRHFPQLASNGQPRDQGHTQNNGHQPPSTGSFPSAPSGAPEPSAHGSGSHGSHGSGGSQGAGSHGPGSPGSGSLGPGTRGLASSSSGSGSRGSETLGSGPLGSGSRGSETLGPGPLGSGSRGSGPLGSGSGGSDSFDSGSAGSDPLDSGPHGTGSRTPAETTGSHGSGSFGSSSIGSTSLGSGARGSDPLEQDSHGAGSRGTGSHGSGSHSSGAHGSGSHGAGSPPSGQPRSSQPALPAGYSGYPAEPQQPSHSAPQPPAQPPPSPPMAAPVPPQPSAMPGSHYNPGSSGGPPAYPGTQLGPYTGPQPAPVPSHTSSPGTTTLADAVKAAHKEGHDFGESVARDAPALWLEAVLARKPRMPSDLEARLLQGSSLPIDFLLHDEVRHALRRGFWDALERARR
jgi:uncharacterized LabA/DUF88 family protein